MDYIDALFTDFSEIHGDRAYGDDSAMTCGMARFHGDAVMVIGNLKGRTLKERVSRRFGSPEPEGYRKALRAMKLAEKFGRPVFTFLDLAGAFPGIGAEERGQGEAIARNLFEMSRLRVPTIATISGGGGGGGGFGAGGGGSRVDARERDLLGDLARGMCVHYVEGREPQAAGGGGPEIHGEGDVGAGLRR
jgi:acetyl-CoA carboxylase carboxyl transferase alpha subunit